MSRNVFVIHGRDEDARERFFELLRAVDLRPLEWEAAVRATRTTAPTLLEVVQAGLRQAAAVVVLLTPDDEVRLHQDLRDPRDGTAEHAHAMQARPNVLVELGLALALCPTRTIIVQLGRHRLIADLGGLNVIRFDGTGSAVGKLVQRLENAGCAVDNSGSDWRSTRRFSGLAAYDRRPGGPA